MSNYEKSAESDFPQSRTLQTRRTNRYQSKFPKNIGVPIINFIPFNQSLVKQFKSEGQSEGKSEFPNN